MAKVTKTMITDKITEKESKLYEEYKRYYEMFGEEHWLTQHAEAKWSALSELVYIDLKLK